MGKRVRLDAIIPNIQTSLLSAEPTSGPILAITYKDGRSSIGNGTNPV